MAKEEAGESDPATDKEANTQGFLAMLEAKQRQTGKTSFRIEEVLSQGKRKDSKASSAKKGRGV